MYTYMYLETEMIIQLCLARASKPVVAEVQHIVDASTPPCLPNTNVFPLNNLT